MTPTLSRADVVAAIRKLQRIPAANAEIACDNVDAIPLQDMIEFYIAVAGGAESCWLDPAGRRSPIGGSFLALLRITRDVMAAPWLIARHFPALTHAARGTALALRPSSLAPILFLRSDHWFNVRSGGSVGHLRGVIENFRALGHETHVVSTDSLAGVPADSFFHLCPPLYSAGRNIPNLPELEYNRALLDFVSKRWATWSPRVIYQRLSLLSYTGAILKARYGTPFVCEYNGSLPWVARHWDRRPLALERLANRTEKVSLMAADLVVVVSEAIRDEAVARGVPEDRILVNPNGVDPEMFHPDVDGSTVRDRFGLGKSLVIGHISTFGPWHGAEVLIEAFAEFLAATDYPTDVRLLMIGDGPGRRAAESLAREHGIAEGVIFTGRTSQMEAPQYLAACDILVSPHVPNPDGSPFFGSPTKLFEYMAMGRAIVASDISQIGQVLRDRETAIMVPAGDTRALAAGLQELAADPSLRCALSTKARAVAVERHTWHMHAKRTIEALEQRLSKRGS